MNNSVIITFGEIAIKSRKVRLRMQNILMDNIRKALDAHGIEAHEIFSIYSRLVVLTDNADEAARVIASRVFGISKVNSGVFVQEKNLKFEEIRDKAAAYFADRLPDGAVFRSTVKREGKQYALNSQEMQGEIGAAIIERLIAANKSYRVDLSDFEFETVTEVRPSGILMYLQSYDGLGGLPVGVQDPAVAIILDEHDLLAALLVTRRGVPLVPLVRSGFDEAVEVLGEIPLHAQPTFTRMETPQEVATQALQLLDTHRAQAVCISFRKGIEEYSSLFPREVPLFMPDTIASKERQKELETKFLARS